MDITPIKILAIDDNLDNLITIKALIKESFHDYAVFTALSGLEGLEMAVVEKPDVILLDIVMPGMDGFDVCKKLKSNIETRDIPVVFVTAIKGDKESRIKGLDVGAEAFLAKPIDESELIAQIRAMIKINQTNLQKKDENTRLLALVDERTQELQSTHLAALNLLEDLRSEIEARRISEDALRESEQKFRDMANLLPQVIFEINLVGEITYVNHQAETLFGYSVGELLTMNSLIIHVPEEHERVKKSITQKLNGTFIANKEFILLRKNGTQFPALIYTNLIIKDSLPVGIRGVVIDIAEQKKAEKVIRESEARYREFVENSPDAIAIYSEGIVTYVNRECLRLMKASTKDQLIGMPVIEFIHPDNRETVVERMQVVAQSENDVSLAVVEEKYIRLDGTPIFVEVKVMPMMLDNKQAYQLTARDITDRKVVEDALEESRVELKTIYNYAPVMMCVIDQSKKIQFANKAFVHLTGTIEYNIFGSQVGDILGCVQSHGDFRGCGFSVHCGKCSLHNAINNTLLTGVGINNIEYQTVMSKNGITNEVFLLSSTAIIENANERKMLLCMVDITDRKKAEIALNESQNQLKMFAAHLQSVREEERTLLAREIHDDLGQILVAMKIDMGIMKNSITKANKNQQLNNIMLNFDDLLLLVDATIKTTRRIMTDLRPEVLDMLGFTEAVRQHLKGFQDRYKVECYLIQNTDKLDLKPQQSVALFRIIQEALNNVAKHAKANSVKIKIDQQSDKLILEIIDDGVGFDMKSSTRIDSYGLIGMKERVFLLDGYLTIKGEIGQGTSVKVQMPM